MKKVRKSLYVKFRPVTLYRDDFYKIYKIFKEQCEKVTIIADNMKSEEKEGIDDFIDAVLKEESTDISNLDIQGHSPRISLTLSNYSTELYARNDSAKDKEIFENLCEILKPRQISNFNIKEKVGFSIYSFFIFIFTTFIFTTFIVAYIDIVNQIITTQRHIDLLVGLILIIVLLMVNFVSIYIKNKHKVLHLKKEYKDTKLLNKCEKNTAICTIIAIIVVPIIVAIFQYLTA